MNNAFLQLIIGILTCFIGYFYLDKKNPEFFPKIINAIKNEDPPKKIEETPQKTEEKKIVEEPIIRQEVPKKESIQEEPTETLPTDEELLPPNNNQNYRKRF